MRLRTLLPTCSLGLLMLAGTGSATMSAPTATTGVLPLLQAEAAGHGRSLQLVRAGRGGGGGGGGGHHGGGASHGGGSRGGAAMHGGGHRGGSVFRGGGGHRSGPSHRGGTHFRSSNRGNGPSSHGQVRRSRPHQGAPHVTHRGGRGKVWIRSHGRRFAWGPGIVFWLYDGTYYGDCDWLREKARDTGSSYWWRRYRNCEDW